MKFPAFSDILSQINQEVSKYRLRNLKTTGSEFPLFSADEKTVSTRSRNISSRETALFRILQIEEALYLDIECYTPMKKSGYTFWSYMPQPAPQQASVYLFHYDQNRNLPHRHDFTELVYVYQGTYTVEIEGRKRIFSTNEICILNPSCEHQELECECSGIFLYLGFRTHTIMEQFRHELTPGLISTFLSGTQKQHARYLILHLPENQSVFAEEYFARIFTELQNPEAGSHIMKLLLLIRFFNFLERNSRDKSETVSNREHGTLLFDKIVCYVEEHLDTVSISELKEKFHYQEDYYNRLFKKTIGLSFRDYLHQTKMKRAKYLLKKTNLPVQKIMDRIGYHSRPHFFHIFQEETGMTPMEYRKTG